MQTTELQFLDTGFPSHLEKPTGKGDVSYAVSENCPGKQVTADHLLRTNSIA